VNGYDKINNMSLRNKINQDIKQALKQGEKEKLEVLRFFNAQVKDKEIEGGRKDLKDKEVIKLINGQLKKLNESLGLFKKGNREELVKKTKIEIDILKKYLPEQLSDEELKKEIDIIVKENQNLPHSGALIGIAVKKLAGKADNQRISQLVQKART